MTKVVIELTQPPLDKRLKLLKKGIIGVHASLRWTLLASRFMGLLPLSGLSSSCSEKLRFTLKSPYLVFFCVSLFGQVLMSTLCIWWLLRSCISLSNITKALFYTLGLVSSLNLVNIGRFWPEFIIKVEMTERQLPPFTRNVAAYCNVTTFVILISAIVEHFTSVNYGVAIARACNSSDIGATFFQYNMPWIFEHTSYSLWKGIMIEIFNCQSTFLWSFNDIFIMIVSIYLTEHFIIHNQLLKKALKQDNFSCDEFRTQFLKIARLVNMFSRKFGIYILISFGANLYWICMQLFYSLRNTYGQRDHVSSCNFNFRNNDAPLYGIEHAVYFIYSFTFLVARTMLVLLLAARVHSSSMLPLLVLYDIPTSKYNLEVNRYINQITNMKVALSGMDFFYVTRAMILTLLGTIITYELVLLQYNK